MTGHRCVILSLVATLAAALAAAPVSAQSDFVLNEDDEWIEVEVEEPTGPELELNRVREAIARRRYARAEQLASRWIDRHGRHRLAPEAYLLRGDALMGQGQYYNALFDFEYVARVYPASDAFVTALQRELVIARLFANGTRRKLWGMRIFSATEEAEELFIRIQERLPGSRLAEEAGIELANFYFRRRQMDLAVEAYELFIENYPRSEYVDGARRRLIYAHLASFKGPRFDAAGLYEARALLLRLKRQDPVSAEQLGADALLVRIDESDAEKLLVTARWYLRTRDFIAAELTIRRLVNKYPRSVATTRALRMMPRILKNLPASVLAETPDYEAIRQGFAEPPAPASESAP
jgi:outer membrane protein assembly factor BamD